MNAVSRNSGIFRIVAGDGGGDTALHEWDFETGADTQKHGDAVKTAPPWA